MRNKILLITIIAAAVGLSSTSSQAACSAVDVANITGAMFGKAAFCQLPTDDFVQKASRKIHACATNSRDESDAVRQYMETANLAIQRGPVGETCSEFARAYSEASEALNAGQ